MITVDVDLYRPVKAQLIKVIDESPNIKTFVLEPENPFSFATGQFIELILEGVGEAPFTPSSSPLVKDQIEVTIMNAGFVTNRIHQLEAGAVMGIRGPYGRGYPLDQMYGREVLVLGGGCGFAPIRSLLYNLEAEQDKIKQLTFCYGSKTPKDCIYKGYIDHLRGISKFNVLRSVDVADEPWNESVGVVTCLLDQININSKEAVAVVVGPPIMMKYGVRQLLDMGFAEDRILLSMEKNMSCGLGKCGHCMMGKYFVCKDGPVFSYEEIKDQPDIWK